MRVFMSISILLATATSAFPYVFPGNANCPFNKPSHTWKDYLSLKYGGKTAPFQVRFKYLRQHLGTIQANGRYLVVRQAGVWEASGDAWGYSRDTVSARYPWGDPAKYEMN